MWRKLFIADLERLQGLCLLCILIQFEEYTMCVHGAFYMHIILLAYMCHPNELLNPTQYFIFPYKGTKCIYM